MQDPTLYGQMNPQFPEQEHLKCPRCDSSNTKFCYYNNYNLSQPRHYCKNCRRYWTKGGALRNIPVGGGSRKNAKRTSTKRSSTTSSLSPSSVTEKAAAVAATSSSSPPPPPTSQILAKPEPNGPPSSFSSLLASNLGQYGPNLQLYGFLNQGHGPSQTQDSGQNPGQNGSRNNNGSNCDGFLSVQNGEDSSSFWNGGSNGWPDLSIYTPGGSSFH